MSNLKSLTFVQAPAKGPNDPNFHRRQRLIERLEEQQRLAKDPSYAPASKRTKIAEDGSKTVVDHYRRLKPWWRLDDKGAVVLIIRSGFTVLEFEKGKAGIAVGAPERLEAVLATLISAARAGELDGPLEAASKSGDRRAKRTKAA